MIFLFGATGDLARKKLIPALESLFEKGFLKESPVICIGRRKISKEEYVQLVKGNGEFLNHLYYVSAELKGKQEAELKVLIEELDRKYKCKGNKIFYLALASDLFKQTIEMIKELKLLEGEGKKRVAFEKPFGFDKRSAEELNEIVSAVFREEQIYRIDHYLGKELVENIAIFRFGNSLFEDIWNKKYVENVQIVLSETVGVETRAEYYEKTGTVRDMIQNHILQILSLVAMEAPREFTADLVRDEKVKVLSVLEKGECVVGQYSEGGYEGKVIPGYCAEQGVAKDSLTETFVALKVFVKNSRWEGVPFYLKTGKRLDKKYSEVNIVLKDVASRLFLQEKEKDRKNVISICIFPDEGIVLRFNAKVPDSRKELEPVCMEFSHKAAFGPNSSEAYETVLKEILKGNQTLFTRFDEIQESWRCVDEILAKIDFKKELKIYPAFSSGPKEADELLRKEGRVWVQTKK